MSRLRALFATIGVALAVSVAAPQAAAAATDVPVTDPNLGYVGRWTTESAGAVPHWAGAYVTTKFTGTTVKVKARNAVNFYASVDNGPDVFYAGVKGVVSLTPTALPAGTHSLRLSYRSGDTIFQGLVLDSGAKTAAPVLPSKLLEFVGDSITYGALTSKLALSAYGWQVGEKLGVRHTQIARSGYCLVAASGCVGQATQFFKTDSTGDAAWDFSRYQAGAVVINLGTNDAGHGVSGPTFQAAYTKLLRDMRAKYPNATLFAFETLKKRYVTETKNAVAALGDAKVRFINTEGWLTTGTDYADGDGHPNDGGHAKIAERLAPILAPTLQAAETMAAAAGNGLPTDTNIKYFGRWNTGSASAYVSEWAGAYVTTGFTGTTVKLKQRGTIDLFASIDGGAFAAYKNVSGTVNLTPQPLRAGNHVLRVSYRPVAGSYHGDAVFGGVTLDSGATTFAPAVPAKLIEFVGDSITVGQLSSAQALTAYGWLVGERLGQAHTQIAVGGACLYPSADGCLGMRDRFLKTGLDASTPDWNFARYQATTVVVNLGTNDAGHHVSGADFQAAYTTLLQRIRAKYPNATILALETFRKRFVTETKNAVAAMGDAKIRFVNTEGWITEATDTVDNVHPNDAGHRKIADRLAPLIG